MKSNSRGAEGDFEYRVRQLASRLKEELNVDRMPRVAVGDIVYPDMPEVLGRTDQLLLAAAVLREAHGLKSWPLLFDACATFQEATSVTTEQARKLQRRKAGAAVRDANNAGLQRERRKVRSYVFARLYDQPKATNSAMLNELFYLHPELKVKETTLLDKWIPEFKKTFLQIQSDFTDVNPSAPTSLTN